jgi:hypothetical protein
MRGQLDRQGAAAWMSGGVLLAGALGTAVPARAQTLATATPTAPQTVQTRTAHAIEWDLPAEADASPGAMVVDTHGDDKNRLFFVTRLGIPRVFQMNPFTRAMKGSAQWTSWDLAEDSFTTGGTRRLRASHDRRFMFVRTAASLQRVDTQSCSNGTCARVEWLDQVGSLNVSDVAVDDQYSVFTTGFTDPLSATSSYVQKVTSIASPPDGTTVSTTATRWTVGGGAGFCAVLPDRTTTSFPCLSGVAVLRSNRNLIYYSEPEGDDGNGNIAELNVYTNAVRRWHLSALAPPDPQAGPVEQPRQLTIDKWGVVWVITGSGHLVSLNPSTNRLRVHTIPMGMASDPFGIAPDDDVVGYTDSGRNMVGMLFPDGPTFYVSPTSGTAPRTTVTIDAVGERSNVTSGSTPPVGKVFQASIFTKADGVFVEAQIDSNGNDDLSPLGISPNKGKGQGTFFYAVGFNGGGANRVGFLRMPKPKKVKHPRDDDDAEDGFDHNQHPNGWHMNDNGDDDDDGLDNMEDTANFENVQVADDAPLQPGQSVDFPISASSTTLALVAVATADDPLAALKVDIYNALGMLMATSPLTPGLGIATLPLPTAGAYTVRVRNMGTTPNTTTPMLITREPWPQ